MRLKVLGAGFCARADTRRSQVFQQKGGQEAARRGYQIADSWDISWER
jgi:hypothetical protein